jgi:DNA-binding XRE family transcriptional regulator
MGFILISKIENWRKGWFLNPFCHLVIKAIRVDSHPCQKGQSLAEMLLEYRRQSTLTCKALAMKLGISVGTLKNWEKGRTRSNRKSWPTIDALLGPKGNFALFQSHFQAEILRVE